MRRLQSSVFLVLKLTMGWREDTRDNFWEDFRDPAYTLHLAFVKKILWLSKIVSECKIQLLAQKQFCDKIFHWWSIKGWRILRRCKATASSSWCSQSARAHWGTLRWEFNWHGNWIQPCFHLIHFTKSYTCLNKWTVGRHSDMHGRSNRNPFTY